nr:MAG TPA: hypothetical protein [Bacteriophage sp.]
MNVKKYDPDPVKRTSTAANVRHRRTGCRGCIYRRDNTCCYCFDTGHPRGCPVEHCTRKIYRR